MIANKSLSESPDKGAARNTSVQESNSVLRVGTALPPPGHKESGDLLLHLSPAVSSPCCLLDHIDKCMIIHVIIACIIK